MVILIILHNTYLTNALYDYVYKIVLTTGIIALFCAGFTSEIEKIFPFVHFSFSILFCPPFSSQ